MKKLLLLSLLILSLGIGNAYAFLIDVEMADSANNFTVNNVGVLDWASSGSGVGQGIGPFGAPVAVGDTFTFSFQARLTGLETDLGAPVPFAGLNTNFEYTIVSQFNETVTSIVANTANFTTEPGGTWYMYYDNPMNSLTSSGFGFDDGILVANGTINAGQTSNFTITSATTGIGSAIIEGLTSFSNPAYLREWPNQLPIFDFRYEGTQNYPPGNSNTTGFFGGDIAGAYASFNVLPNDLLLKVDGSSSFSAIPEPSTLILFGTGLLGLAHLSRRKKIKK